MRDAVGVQYPFDEVREVFTVGGSGVRPEDARQIEDGGVTAPLGAPRVLLVSAIFRPLSIGDHGLYRGLERRQLVEHRVLGVQGSESLVQRLDDFSQRFAGTA